MQNLLLATCAAVAIIAALLFLLLHVLLALPALVAGKNILPALFALEVRFISFVVTFEAPLLMMLQTVHADVVILKVYTA